MVLKIDIPKPKTLLPRTAVILRPTGRGEIVLDEVDRNLMGLKRETIDTRTSAINELLRKAQTRKVTLPKGKEKKKK